MQTKIDMQKELKQAILCKSTIWINDTINYWVEICSKTVKKWLNYLGYK